MPQTPPRAAISVLAALVALAALMLGGAGAWAATPCPDSPHLALRLPHLRAALQAHQPVRIVALGSSSTLGVAASAPARTYPAMLEQALRAALPGVALVVVNRGVAGQDATEELGRLQRDTIALRPQLVIWQVGANAAIRGSDPQIFTDRVQRGVAMLQAADADVVLMDNQRAPKILRTSLHLRIENALARVAAATGADLFSRGQLMDAWQAEGVRYATFIAPDHLHQNDLGYRCIADTLATDMLAGLQAPPRELASRQVIGTAR